VPVPTELRERFAARRRNVVIFAHDFFDSPHVDRKLQFPDLYRFLEETLAALTDVRDTTVFVKAHPNAVDNCKDRTIELTARFGCPHFHVLDESVSNRSLIELRPDVAATARGTVALEMAYHGVPTVALYDNPYVNFDFVHTCMDKAAFFAILRGEATPLVDCDRDKIRSYFYQAFMEKVDVEAADILNLLATFKGDTYNDRYLRFLESHATTIFAPRLVDEFRRALAS